MKYSSLSERPASAVARGIARNVDVRQAERSPLRRSTGAGTKVFADVPQEPEDVRITGGTRSLVRRLMALNIGGSLRETTRFPPEPMRPGRKLAS